jgi:hypothetical protein
MKTDFGLRQHPFTYNGSIGPTHSQLLLLIHLLVHLSVQLLIHLLPQILIHLLTHLL